ncbi:MAG TPA: hypothetical protein VII30_10750 [Gemmatimonadaceae bacterium]
MATPARATLAGRAQVEEVLKDAHRHAWELEPPDLAGFLADRLGRPTVARLTGATSPNSVTKWRLSKAVPERPRLDRMREAAMVYFSLTGIGLSEVNAEQWFRGANPVLGFRMPVDVLADGDLKSVIDAVRNHVTE